MSIGIFGKVTGGTNWSSNNNLNNPFLSSSSSTSAAASPASAAPSQTCTGVRRTTYSYNPKKKNCKYKYECVKSDCEKKCEDKLTCKTLKKYKCTVIQQTVCPGDNQLRTRSIRTRVKRDIEEKARRRQKRTIGAIIEAKKEFWRRLFGIKKQQRPNYISYPPSNPTHSNNRPQSNP